MINRRVALPALFVAAAAAGACAYRQASPLNPADPKFAAAAPDSFDVEMTTTKGTIFVRVRRDWSPNGAARFYTLVRNGFYTDVAFHRTVRNFVAQFGIHGDSAVSAAWNGKNIPDDSVRATNARGTLVFARGGANSRGTQLYFNLVDNARLDTLNGFGFPPIGRIVEGLSVIDSLNSEYSSGRAGQPATPPRQDSLRLQGNAYLRRSFPRLDYIVRTRIVRSWD